MTLTYLQKYLSRQYAQKLDLTLCEGISRERPSWLFVSESNFVQPVQGYSDVAAILDPEVGLLMFAIDYKGGDLQAEFSNALLAASRLLAAKTSDDRDPRGGWRVGLLWLVRSKDENPWRRAIAERRSRSGATEEIGLDVLFYESVTDLDGALSDHGIPWLLTEYRSLLSLPRSGLASWASANQDVLDAVAKFDSFFDDKLARELAGQVVARAVSWRMVGEPIASLSANVLKTLELRNFRNLKSADLSFESDAQSNVWTNVLYGPNGSGKSSIVEALTIAQTGSSRMMIEFERDEDRRSGITYRDELLQTIGAAEKPAILLNGRMVDVPSSVNEIGARSSAANILSQEASRDFVRMRGVDLAAYALRNYSDLADSLLEYVDQQTHAANSRKEDLLRSLGERVSISKVDTLVSRIARNVIASELPQESSTVTRWLANFSKLEHSLAEEASSLLAQGASKFSSAARVELEGKLARELNPPNREAVERILRRWLSEWNSYLQRLDDLTSRLRKDDWQAWIGSQIADVEVAAEVARSRSTTFSHVGATKEAQSSAFVRREQLRRSVERTLEEGRLVKAELTHLQAVDGFLSEWVKSHPDRCPTCGDVHPEGIHTLVASRAQELGRKREELLTRYERERKELNDIEKAPDSGWRRRFFGRIAGAKRSPTSWAHFR
jgi:energy-coupling factor transporter ATP-binding protein EcfA2